MSDNDKIEIKDVTQGEANAVTQTYDLYQAHQKIYVRRIKGFFRSLRFSGGLFLFTLYFGLAWINVEGRQAVLFDLPQRKFHIFGVTFWPQDIMLLTWLLIISAFALFFITVYAGRIWCGYTCPQSAWTWIFMWLEEKTEGQRNKRIKLDAQPWNLEKAARKTAKHLSWFLVALWTAVTFVGYFTPIRELVPDLFSFNVGGWSLFFVFFFTLATYGNAGWLREQVCIYMCPYARFQSVMFDKDTLIVSYDPRRGDPRGSRKRGVDPKTEGLGDCIDCDLCVQVCPTGIDIRDGLQYECIGCAACIDACDSVMEKMDYDKGLISYTTEHNLSGEKTKMLRPRLLGYGAVLLVMMVMFAATIITRIPLELDIIRDRGALHRITSYGMVENIYTLRVMNMAEAPRTFAIEVEGIDGLKYLGDNQVELLSGEARSFAIRLEAKPDALPVPSNKILFTVTAADDEDVQVVEESRFFGPANF